MVILSSCFVITCACSTPSLASVDLCPEMQTQMLLERGETYNNSSLCSMSDIAECRPTIKWLMARTLLDVHKHENLLHFPEGEEDNSDWWVIDKLKGSNSEESEEDDIEDW